MRDKTINCIISLEKICCKNADDGCFLPSQCQLFQQGFAVPPSDRGTPVHDAVMGSPTAQLPAGGVQLLRYSTPVQIFFTIGDTNLTCRQ